MITVWTEIDANTVVGSIEANLNYDTSKLKFQSVEYGSSFDTQLDENVAEDVGVVTVIRGATGGMTGHGQIFGVTFLLKSAGNANFTLSPVDGADQNGRISVSVKSLTIKIADAPSVSQVAPTADNNSSTSSTSQTSGNTNSGSPTASSSTNSPTSSSSPATSTSSSSSTSTNSGTSGTSAKKPAASSTTSKTTATASISPAPDYSSSEVSFNKTTATADGKDKICTNITVKDKSGAINKKIKPEIAVDGGADKTDLTLQTDSWSSCISSSQSGDKKVTVSVSGIIVKDSTVSFVDPMQSTVPEAAATVPSTTLLDAVNGTVAISGPKDIFHPSEITDHEKISLQGVGKPGTTLAIYIHSSDAIRKIVTVGNDGKWSLALDQSLAAGAHRVDAALLDKYGNESTPKVVTRFSVVRSFVKRKILLYLSPLILLLAAAAFVFTKRRKGALVFAHQTIANIVHPDNGVSEQKQVLVNNGPFLTSLADNSNQVSNQTDPLIVESPADSDREEISSQTQNAEPVSTLPITLEKDDTTNDSNDIVSNTEKDLIPKIIPTSTEQNTVSTNPPQIPVTVASEPIPVSDSQEVPVNLNSTQPTTNTDAANSNTFPVDSSVHPIAGSNSDEISFERFENKFFHEEQPNSLDEDENASPQPDEPNTDR